MKKSGLILLSMLMALLIIFPSASYAAGSLDDVISDSGASSSSSSSVTSGSSSSSSGYGGFIDDLNDAARVEQHAQDISAGTSSAQIVITKAIQWISYLTVALLSLSVAADIAYLAIPFTVVRNFLSGGKQGVAPQGGQQGAMGGMNTGIGGYGAGGYGAGGYGAGGFNRGGYGAMGTMGTMGQQGAQQQQSGGHCWVHNAALNAVAAAGTPNPATGKPQNSFILYAKDMVVMLILVPVLLILLISGTLTDVGFFIGSKIVTALSGITR